MQTCDAKTDFDSKVVLLIKLTSIIASFTYKAIYVLRVEI